MKVLSLLKEKKVIVIIALYILLDVLSRLPYINIYLAQWMIFTLLWISIITLYRMSYRYTFLLIVFSAFLSAIVIILKRDYIALASGLFMYLMIVVGAIQFGIQTIKEQKKR